MESSFAADSATPPVGRGSRGPDKSNDPIGSDQNATSGKPASQGGIIAALIEAAKRQETLIEAITAAVDSGKEAAILQAARNLAANRRRPTPLPCGKPGRKKRETS